MQKKKNSRSKNFTKALLHQKYVVENKPTYKIAIELKCNVETIRNYLRKYSLNKGRHHRFQDLTGRRFGMLVVLKESEKDKHDKTRWLCQCDCGNKKEIVASSLKRKWTTSCGCYGKNRAYRGYQELSISYWNHLIYGAKKRNFDFSISIEYAWDLFLKQNRRCALTGLEIKLSRGSHKYLEQNASLDRIDIKKGYIEGNVQWVHKVVNKFKNTFSQQEILYLCKLIYNNHKIESDQIQIKIEELKWHT